METPVLTKKQKKQALSANKPKTKKRKSLKIRNVLGSTKSATCPQLSLNATNLLSTKLKSALSNTVPVRVNWTDIKLIPKEERKAFRNQQNHSVKSSSNSYVIFGINGVTRAVERKQTSLVLIADDINPHLMIKHLIESCTANKIAIFTVDKFRELVKDCVGFPAIAIAFKDVPKTESLHSVIEFVKLFTSIKPDPTEIDTSESEDSFKLLVKPEYVAKDVYLYRQSRRERCFIPKISEQCEKPRDEDERDFIRFAPEASTSKLTEKEMRQIGKEVSRKRKNNYDGPKIKRLKSNLNRVHKGKSKKD